MLGFTLLGEPLAKPTQEGVPAITPDAAMVKGTRRTIARRVEVGKRSGGYDTAEETWNFRAGEHGGKFFAESVGKDSENMRVKLGHGRLHGPGERTEGVGWQLPEWKRRAECDAV